MRATLEEFLRLPEGTLAEYIGGEILMSPSPKIRYQRIVSAVFRAVDRAVRLESLGEVFLAPLDVHLPSGDVVQPDVLFVSTARESIVQDWVRGAPDLVVEVLSPETRDRDLRVKADLYLANGVIEVWIVDPETSTIETRTARGRVVFKDSGSLETLLLPGFQLALAPLFAVR